MFTLRARWDNLSQGIASCNWHMLRSADECSDCCSDSYRNYQNNTKLHPSYELSEQKILFSTPVFFAASLSLLVGVVHRWCLLPVNLIRMKCLLLL